MTTYTIAPAGALRGRLQVPGDKSISHRAIILGALAEGVTRIDGFLLGRDTLCTLEAFREMGVQIQGPDSARVVIEGVGLHGLRAPERDLDLGNSGTAMRLLAGVLAGQRFDTRLIGDASLMSRPMHRITVPLAEMKATVGTSDAGTPPLQVRGCSGTLRGIDYALPVASAQVKSCLLLAGLYADRSTCVTEPATTRDHTERMLTMFGRAPTVVGGRVCLANGGRLHGTSVQVPGDLSSAAFFIVGALIGADCDLTLERVGINPTRTGVLDILRAMGGDIEIVDLDRKRPEPVASLRVRSSALRGIDIDPRLVSLAIDEFPAIFVAAACAQGVTTLRGARELRVKESDRIASMAQGLGALGVEASPTDDGMVVTGGPVIGGTAHSCGDHRVAMALSMVALRAREPVRVEDCANVETSFPGFVESARQVGLELSATDSNSTGDSNSTRELGGP